MVFPLKTVEPEIQNGWGSKKLGNAPDEMNWD
jgi:hypothetical protein